MKFNTKKFKNRFIKSPKSIKLPKSLKSPKSIKLRSFSPLLNKQLKIHSLKTLKQNLEKINKR